MMRRGGPEERDQRLGTHLTRLELQVKQRGAALQHCLMGVSPHQQRPQPAKAEGGSGKEGTAGTANV